MDQMSKVIPDSSFCGMSAKLMMFLAFYLRFKVHCYLFKCEVWVIIFRGERL